MTERKTALITGASRGIGRATAVEFARRGYRLVLNYRSAEEEARLLERELREGYGTQVLLCRADVRAACHPSPAPLGVAVLQKVRQLVAGAVVYRQADVLAPFIFGTYPPAFAVAAGALGAVLPDLVPALLRYLLYALFHAVGHVLPVAFQLGHDSSSQGIGLYGFTHRRTARIFTSSWAKSTSSKLRIS